MVVVVACDAPSALVMEIGDDDDCVFSMIQIFSDLGLRQFYNLIFGSTRTNFSRSYLAEKTRTLDLYLDGYS
jgi:hypothetical protein